MLVLDDEGGRGDGVADDVQTRLDALGVYRREARPWLPHVTVLRFRQRPRLRPPLPTWARSSVRCGCLPIPAAPGRGGVRRPRIGCARRLDQVDREQALDAALGQIERQFGKGSVMKMNDRAAVSIGAVSTGSLSLDLALGIGGLPRGRIVEIFGPESSGKTTLVYHVIAEAQRRGGICAFIDAEHAMDPAYAKRIGVDIDDLLVSQPGHRRAGARDRRAAHPLGRARRRRGRLGRRAHAEGRDRGRDGRQPRRPAGAPDEPGAAQARRHAQPHRHDLPLHEPAAREDRRHVRQPRDDAGRPRAQVLLVGAARHPPDRDAQGRASRRSATASASRW